MYIHQNQLENLEKLLAPQKVVVIYGPRRCGKTTLITKFLETKKNEKTLFVTADDLTVQEYLGSQRLETLKSFVGDATLLVIDEAQRIKNIGINLKLMVDAIPKLKIIATGSSAFDLAKNLGEPLAGRKYTVLLFPLAQMELSPMENAVQTKNHLEERLLFGSYPEVILMQGREKKIRYLKEVLNAYLLKDILELDGIRNSDKILKLLQLISFQIGKEVSCTELGSQLGMSKNTVERYLDLLEKSFVIFKLRALSRNPRKEISKNHRYYFFDNGVMNALVNNFNPLSLRNDVGALWENYIVMERRKKQEYKNLIVNNYFWRTYNRQEIDWIEEREGALWGYEIKWKKESKSPSQWNELYPKSHFHSVTSDNYLKFIL